MMSRPGGFEDNSEVIQEDNRTELKLQAKRYLTNGEWGLEA